MPIISLSLDTTFMGYSDSSEAWYVCKSCCRIYKSGCPLVCCEKSSFQYYPPHPKKLQEFKEKVLAVFELGVALSSEDVKQRLGTDSELGNTYVMLETLVLSKVLKAESVLCSKLSPQGNGYLGYLTDETYYLLEEAKVNA